MKEDLDIIKVLREEERLGKHRKKIQRLRHIWIRKK